ncbi:MAG: PAS domain-containing protein [Gemmataceae bacterium]
MSPDLPPLRLLDALPQLVWAAGPAGELEYVNTRCAEYTGIPADDLLGWEWGWVVHPEDLPDTLNRWAAARVTVRPYHTEHRLRRADGRYRCFVSRAEPTVDPGGVVVGWVGTSTDIDDFRRAGAATREANGLIRAFVERALVGCVLVGSDRVVRYVNPWFAGLLGYPPGALAGADAADWVHPDDRPALAAAATDLLGRPGGQADGCARLRRADGTYHRVRLRVTNLLPDPDVRALAVAVEAPPAG